MPRSHGENETFAVTAAGRCGDRHSANGYTCKRKLGGPNQRDSLAMTTRRQGCTCGGLSRVQVQSDIAVTARSPPGTAPLQPFDTDLHVPEDPIMMTTSTVHCGKMCWPRMLLTRIAHPPHVKDVCCTLRCAALYMGLDFKRVCTPCRGRCGTRRRPPTARGPA